MTTNRKNTARSQEVVRGPYAPTTAKSHLHLVDDKADTKKVTAKKCDCGKEIVGPHKTCGQCNLLEQAKFRGQELHACANNCGALTPFSFCWNCNRSVQDKASVSRKFRTEHPDDPRFQRDAGSKPSATKNKTCECGREVEAPYSICMLCQTFSRPGRADGYEDLRAELRAKAETSTPSETVIETDDATIEYRELNVNEAINIRLVAAEVDEEEELEEMRRARATREAKEALEAVRMAEVRAKLRQTFTDDGMWGLLDLGAIIVERTMIIVGDKAYPNPHFTVRVKDGTVPVDGFREFDFHDQERADDIKKARLAYAEKLEAAAKARREAEAAARRIKHAPKKDAPKPGKSGGDSKAKGGKKGKK